MLKALLPRKKIFVSRIIQGRLATRIGCYWVLYHFVLWHALFAYRYAEYRLEHEGPPASFRELYGGFADQYYPVLICALAMLPVFLIDLFHLTHKIAGPLIRFQKSLRAMTAGEPVSRIRLRKGDLLTELEQDFNNYVDCYERRRQARHPGRTMDESDASLIQQIVDLRTVLEECGGSSPAEPREGGLAVSSDGAAAGTSSATTTRRAETAADSADTPDRG